jgi:molecular chaperone DnaJ
VVSIPAGIDHGQQIRLTGEGQPGSSGGPTGSLYLEVQVKPHKFFRRKGTDIFLDLSINIAQAVLGAEVQVPTVDGESSLKIPAGTQPGKVFTIRGKGVPTLRGNGRGDEHVIVNVDIPTRLNEDQRVLFEQLAVTLGTQVKPQEKGFIDILKDVFGG